MAARANLPKIITDVQDIVTQLGDDFKSTNEPITDDNHALHKLCAKLEFLFSSCTKEKSMLGNKKNYWHWIYACLKNTKGLGDGLKFVQANKELRTSKGRGRAFIRYCLVHQTLADSLQNCVMNLSITRQYFTSDSLLVNPTYSSSFVTSLYELNAVNFDLNAKGYDLDSGWPTFASKIRNSVPSDMDQWAIRSHIGSLGSFPSASVVMDTPRMHGSGSSGPHSVDQRVEELVLELDQSDQKIKDQEQVILDLEAKAENIAKSTGEKEEILARVISDLESKNRHLHVAMSKMSSEFEAREEQWSNKHDQIIKELAGCENKNQELVVKIKQLEQDKRTLEDTVSQRMSAITSAFVPTTDGDVQGDLHSSHRESDKLRSEIRELTEELAKSRQRCIELQMDVDRIASDSSAVDNGLVKKLEEKQAKIDFLEEKLASITTEHKLFINNVKGVLLLKDDVTEIGDILDEIVKLRDHCKSQNETLQQAQNAEDFEQAASLKEENELLKFDRDIAHLDADSIKQKLRMANLEIRSLKIEHESERSRAANRIRELEENHSIQQHQMENQQRHHKEMLVDLKLTQDALQQSEKELEETKQRYQELQQSQRDLREDLDQLKQLYDEEKSDNESTIEELQAELTHHSSLSDTLDRQLEAEKVKSGRLSSELLAAKQVAESFSKQLNETNFSISESEKSLLDLRTEVSRLTVLESAHQKQITFLSGIVEHFLEQIRLIDKSEDLDTLNLEEKSSEECDVEKWTNLSATFHNISIEHRKAKRQFQELQSRFAAEKEEMQAYKTRVEKDAYDLQEQLNEFQAANDIHLVTIKDLSDKHKILQDAKADNLDKIDRLQVEISDLNIALNKSKSEGDNLRLRVMEESAKVQDTEDKLKTRDEDIENLKDKITQLLLDKDHLWKEGELLKDQLEDQIEVLEESSWVDDNDVSKCSSCAVPFSITVRKHHCRNCGKIFCNNCSSNWTVKHKKKVRFCDHCFNTTDLDMSSISPSKSFQWSTPKSQSMSSTKDSEQLSETCSVLDDSLALENDSISDSRDDSQGSLKGEDTITVAARREFHLPVRIEHPGVTLHWEISTDRDIGFKICYASTEEEAMFELVPLSRINSHVEPFIGDLVARQAGVYSLVFDNTYSRFTSKSVTYKLGTLSNTSQSST